MVWSVADERFEENLAACRTYYDQHWTLCAPRTAAALGRPIGQFLANLRRPGALDGHPGRAAALAAIDPDWNPDWPTTWQRHYAALRELVRDEGVDGDRPDILPGLTIHGMDIGRWHARQRQPAVWAQLTEGQRERLEQLGVQPHPHTADTATARGAAGGGAGAGTQHGVTGGKGPDAFQKAIAALAQYQAREGHLKVPRGHVEVLAAGWGPDRDGEAGVEVRLGVFLSNSKSRRAKLSPERLGMLARLGLHWVEE
ncbi:helicase associated domain-containing protein [Streptomyces sp. NPDC004609]|uniref:helicase associated domain-containing protein n=1 Tax=Streptomyces sp. NPDC004609 TaxID=3364704 RepID=UPI00369C7DCC